MTKELSKQICDKCGIKPQYKYKVWLPAGVVDTFDKYDLEYIEFKVFKNKKPKVIEVIKVYPEFGEPSNFVKLFELPFTTRYFDWTVGEFVTVDNPEGTKDRIIFLDTLLRFLDYIPDGKKIQQVIREAEWKYE